MAIRIGQNAWSKDPEGEQDKVTRRHILVTDDEEHTLLALSLVLRKAGFRVTTFSDGTEALDKVLELTAAAEPIDLLVVDIEMPGMTGLEVIEKIERLNLVLPIVVISGYEARGLLAERLRLGGVWFLEKPFEPEAFICRVNDAINQTDGLGLGLGIDESFRANQETAPNAGNETRSIERSLRHRG
ncbi:MAG: response regulator [Proteobacteria bacterium]|nr:response regulator [Pseudomonadota bacterium]